ncbi:hypothetical protein G9A89_010684 [Geosiphon pyriformis]|nr:hypothetical protein G9A89_010684 [Geosiphon pyriformis]
MARKQKTTNKLLTSTPRPADNQKIARVLGGRGKNLHEVEYSDQSTTLCTLPPKFRSLVWVKRGSYVIIAPSESDRINKIGGEIVHVLLPKHIKELKSEGIWSKEFDVKEDPSFMLTRSHHEENSDSDIFVNTNREVVEDESSSSEGSHSDSEE